MKRQLDRDAYYSRVLVDCFSNGPVLPFRILSSNEAL